MIITAEDKENVPVMYEAIKHKIIDKITVKLNVNDKP